MREGELISGVVNGWNFGDGHLHNAQLLEAVQERCGFEPGELRVITLESQPAHIQRQHYRIYDAATGLIEEGWVERRRHGRARALARRVVGLPRRGHAPGARGPGPGRVSAAVVVGSGPNGLACAAALAARGVRVTVLEAEARSAAARAPASSPSPACCTTTARRFTRWRSARRLCSNSTRAPRARVALARGRPRAPARRRQRRRCCARSRTRRQGWATTAARGSGSSARPREFDVLGEDLMRPVLHVPRHPLRLARFGLPAALPATLLARRFARAGRALFGGVAAHAFSPLNRPMSSSVGMALTCACHRFGWPVAAAARGRSPTRSPRSSARAEDIETGRRVSSLAELPPADAVPRPRARRRRRDRRRSCLPGGPRLPALPPRPRGLQGRPRGRGRRAVDQRSRPPRRHRARDRLLRGDRCRRARGQPRPHAGAAVRAGRQQYLADPARSTGDVHPVWAYAHVPAGSTATPRRP